VRNVYEKQKVGENVYRITECMEPNGPGVNLFLVTGKTRSLLFDSGFGVVDTLREELKQLTPSPIVCVVGHGHPDHVGAAPLFDTVYMNEKDAVLLPVALSYERRMEDVFGRGAYDEELFSYAKTHIVDPGGKNFSWNPIRAGDVVTVDEERFEVFEIPGHTQGSIALLNREKNYAFISDAVGVRTALVNLPPEKRVGMIAYRDGLARFLSEINEETVLWYGHSREPLPQQVMRDMLNALNEVLNGETQQDAPSISHFAKRKAAQNKKMMEHRSGCVTLVYDANLL
jgi:glyoxylase-like metal-dependent hydrolase (beta-lactamase superfamily II)